MARWRKTGTKGLYIAHEKKCPAYQDQSARCRCAPSFRGAGWDPDTRRAVFSPSSRSRAETLSWMSLRHKGREIRREPSGPPFAELADEWWELVDAGRIAKRRGNAKRYSETTKRGYRQSLEVSLKPEFGHLAASDIKPVEFQRWIDRLSREGKSRSRILNHLAVIRGVYAYACYPTRRIVETNPTAGLQLPPNDERPRDRVALVNEATELLDALDLELSMPYAVAMFAGLRRSEIDRLDWTDVLWDEERLLVRLSKSDAGSWRRPPMGRPLIGLLREEHLRQGRPESGRILTRSVFSGKLGEAASKAWEDASEDRDEPLVPITLHEARHTYASMLMAARYTQIMEFMGHKDLSATQRYLKRLPQPQEASPAGRLNEYLDAFTEGAG